MNDIMNMNENKAKTKFLKNMVAPIKDKKESINKNNSLSNKNVEKPLARLTPFFLRKCIKKKSPNLLGRKIPHANVEQVQCITSLNFTFSFIKKSIFLRLKAERKNVKILKQRATNIKNGLAWRRLFFTSSAPT